MDLPRAMSTDSDDSRHQAWLDYLAAVPKHHQVLVRVDGVEVADACLYDQDEGIAVRAKRDEAGKIMMTPDHRAVALETLRGEVTVGLVVIVPVSELLPETMEPPAI